MRITNTGDYQVDLSVYVRGKRVLETRIGHKTQSRHPTQIGAEVAYDYKKQFMQRADVKQAAVLPEEVEVRTQLVYS